MFELSVAVRFLTQGKMQTLLILVGISVGVAVQIFLSALIGGLQKDLLNKTVGTSPHVTATAAQQPAALLYNDSLRQTVVKEAGGSNRDRQPIRNWEPVTNQLRRSGMFSVVSVVAEEAAFAFRGEKSVPVMLRGVVIEDADRLYRLTDRLQSGDTRISSNRVLIGSGLAEKLKLSVGGTLRIGTATGKSDLFFVAGVFDLELKPLNDTWVFLKLPRAQALFDLTGGITAIETQVPKIFDADLISRTTAKRFPSLEWVSWQENNASLLAGLRSQSESSNMIQVLVLLAVTLGISSVLAVSAIQKARQIGILKAIGATRKTISRIFLIMGALLGAIGAISGCVLGYGLIIGFHTGTVATTGKPLFPLSISPSLYALSILIATAAGTIAASIPARRSARLNPVEVIRNG